jgi:predicted DNA-binding transcriptional regulator AlpA
MTSERDHIRPAGGIDTVVELLNRPALARVSVDIPYRGPVAPPEVMDALNLSKSTTYEYVDRLVDLGLVERDDWARPPAADRRPDPSSSSTSRSSSRRPSSTPSASRRSTRTSSTSRVDTVSERSSPRCAAPGSTSQARRASGWSQSAIRAQGYADSITVYGVADISGDGPRDSLRLNAIGKQRRFRHHVFLQFAEKHLFECRGSRCKQPNPK